MASCHCRLTSLRSVKVSTISYSRLSGHCLKMPVKHYPGVRLLSPRLLQLCSSVCISEGLVNRLQSIQNAAARLVTGTRRSDTKRRCSVSYIGCRYARASTSRLRRLFIGRCLAFHHRSIVPSQRPPSFCRCSRVTTIRSTTC